MGGLSNCLCKKNVMTMEEFRYDKFRTSRYVEEPVASTQSQIRLNLVNKVVM